MPSYLYYNLPRCILFGIASAALLTSVQPTFAAPPVVKIPGKIKKDGIVYATALQLDPTEAVIAPKTTVFEDKENTTFGVEITRGQWSASKTKTTWKELENPTAILALYAPIPLEVELSETKGDRTVAGRITPDSVAAWNRLKTWRDLQRALTKEQIAKIDQSASDLEEKTQEIILSGTVRREDIETLQKGYEIYSRNLGDAFDQTSDFDLQRQISTTIDGVRGERIAWKLSGQINMPAVNPNYRNRIVKPEDASQKPSDPSSSPASETGGGPLAPNQQKQQPQTPPIQKAVGDDALVLYEDYLRQAPRSATYYKSVYELGRSTVAICDNRDNNSIPFATGTIIGRNLVLTCAHAVARPGRGGSPAQRGPDDLQVKVGYYAPDDLVTPVRTLPAELIFEGGYDPTRPNSDRLDFALLKVEELEKYSQEEFANAEALRRVHEEEIRVNPNAGFLRNPRAYFAPFTCVPLANFEAIEKQSFFICGHPAGYPKAVTDFGTVFYPRILTPDEKDDKRRSIPSQASDAASTARNLQLFDAMYMAARTPTGDLYFRYTYANNSPGIGVVCSTMRGNSGSAAIVVGRAESHIIGILVDGQPGNPRPLTPSLDQHEQLLPIVDIIKHLDENFKKELNSNKDFEKGWRTEYGVSILKRPR